MLPTSQTRVASPVATSENYAIEDFYPKELCYAADAAVRWRSEYCGATYGSGEFLQWIPAEGISAAILSHHINYDCLYMNSTTRAKAACERLGCSTRTRHADLGNAYLVLYVHGKEKGFLITSSKRKVSEVSSLRLQIVRDDLFSQKQLLAVKHQSTSYARRHGVTLENIIRAEFATSAWIVGKVPNYVSSSSFD
jgi:hypothetical protein